jgi:hypothetical protein
MVESRLYDLIKATDFDLLFQSLGYRYYKEGDYNVNIIGVRNLLDAKRKGNTIQNVQRDKFDDAIVITYKEDGVWKRRVHAFTTDPGAKILKSPSNINGTAILCPGQYVSTYMKDKHNGKYYALCQRLGNVTVFRDKNKDNTLDMNSSNIQSGRFGINIHRASQWTDSDVIGAYSAGCQVFKHKAHFDDFMKLIDKAIKLHGNKFTYTLITSDDIKVSNKK